VNISAFDVHGNGAWAVFHIDSIAETIVKPIVAFFTALAHVIVEAASAAIGWIWSFVSSIIATALQPASQFFKDWSISLNQFIDNLYAERQSIGSGGFFKEFLDYFLGPVGWVVDLVFDLLGAATRPFEPFLSTVQSLMTEAVWFVADAIQLAFGAGEKRWLVLSPFMGGDEIVSLAYVVAGQASSSKSENDHAIEVLAAIGFFAAGFFEWYARMTKADFLGYWAAQVRTIIIMVAVGILSLYAGSAAGAAFDFLLAIAGVISAFLVLPKAEEAGPYGLTIAAISLVGTVIGAIVAGYRLGGFWHVPLKDRSDIQLNCNALRGGCVF